MASCFVIFTDLDGTLLDAETYSYEAARPALAMLKKRQIPVVLCTSKTRAETEAIARRLGLKHPFYCRKMAVQFSFRRDIFSAEQLKVAGIKPKRKGNYLVIELGLPYQQLDNF